MPLDTLFGKLQEHEKELDRLERHELDHDKLEKHELCEVKLKSVDLKYKHDSDHEEESQSKDVEDDALIKKI